MKMFSFFQWISFPLPFLVWLIVCPLFPVSAAWPQDSVAPRKTLYDFRETIPNAIRQIEAYKEPVGNPLDSRDLFVYHDTLFISPSGTFMLFYQDPTSGECIRIDSCIYHGFNFGKNLFVCRDTIYSVGGYGFWNLHAMIIYYHPLSHSWKLLLRKRTIPDGRFRVSFLTGNTIFGLLPESQQEYEKTLHTPSEKALYQYNLDSKKWKKIKNLNIKGIEEAHQKGGQTENERWLFTGNILVDKQHLMAYIILDPPGLMDNPREGNLFRITEDSLFAYTKTSAEKFIPVNLNIGEVMASPSTIRFSLRPTPLVNKIWFWIALALVPGAFILTLAGIRRRKRRSGNRQTESDNTTAIIRQLHESERLVLSTEELDQILGIAHLTYDSRKQRRSFILRHVEEKAPNLIIRERSEQDKRTYHYCIRKP